MESLPTSYLPFYHREMNESSCARIAVLGAVGLLGLGALAADDDAGRQAEVWAARCPDADRVLLDAAGVAAFNRRLLAVDASVRDLAALPETLAAADVAALVRGCSQLPEHPLSRGGGSLDAPDAAVSPADRGRWVAALSLESIPARVMPRFALVTRRAALRRFPTAERVRRPGGPADIDLFQESAFFPGTPVAAVHATADDRWTFVVGTTYAAWIETSALAFTARDTALDFARRCTLVVTAARATAVPLAAGAADVVLDMGTVLPAGHAAAADHPAGSPDRSVELPVRSDAGMLALVAARVEPAGALSAGPLPASRGQLLRQAFRFLGEPYGWGHDHGARDCSGFVCEVYRSLGLLLPRNTRDQAVSPALDRTAIGVDWPRSRRLAALSRLRPGDLVYVPRHVMMIVGHDAAGPWVIHDTHAGRLADEAEPAHGVVVAPLARLLDDDGGRVVDAVTVLVRILPSDAEPLP
jgi:cell wall-associated NlpC family hydrolase